MTVTWVRQHRETARQARLGDDGWGVTKRQHGLRNSTRNGVVCGKRTLKGISSTILSRVREKINYS